MSGSERAQKMGIEVLGRVFPDQNLARDAADKGHCAAITVTLGPPYGLTILDVVRDCGD